MGKTSHARANNKFNKDTKDEIIKHEENEPIILMRVSKDRALQLKRYNEHQKDDSTIMRNYPNALGHKISSSLFLQIQE